MEHRLGTGPVRIHKYLSWAGVASRRQAERLLLEGRVRVNGRVVTQLGFSVVPAQDLVEVDGGPVVAPLESGPGRWLMLHKPSGVLTSARDRHGRSTVFDLLPLQYRTLRYVGRLDRDTEGLLLFTDRGELLHRLTHPSFGVEREYRVWVEGKPHRRTLERLRKGVQLEDGAARVQEARLLRTVPGAAVLQVVMTEGRKREVRRLLDVVGHPVVRLRRVRFGPIRLGSLKAGQWRLLTNHEIRALARTAGVRGQEGEG